MPGLKDIAATPVLVEVRGTSIPVYGISAAGFAYLMRFDEIRALMSGKELALDVESLAKAGPKALAAILACGTGDVCDPEAETAAASLTIDEQAGLLAEILALTFPRGLGPFAADIQRLAGAVEGMSGAGTKAPATT